MINIILNEWKRLLRNRMFIDLTLFFTLSLVIVVSFGVNQNLNQEEYRSKAQKHVRNQWDNLEAMNPHRAAHYGSYAFKPINILNSMDGGVNDITGNVLKLEGHVQNEIVYSEASQSLTISKFGKLKSWKKCLEKIKKILMQYVLLLGYENVHTSRRCQRDTW